MFITTKAAATRHAVYAIERSNPAAIQAEGNGTVGMVGQFPWGPDNAVIEPTDASDRTLIIAPPGMDHTGSGYMCIQGKAWPDLRLVRALGTAAAVASCPLVAAGPITVCTVLLKYKGTAGNAVTCTIKPASDGDANHFDLDVTVSGASGSTTDVFQNLNYSATGTKSTPDFTKCRLVGSITVGVDGRPTNATLTCTGGTNGTINSGRYLGTPGSADAGLALFEGVSAIDIVFTDDPGDTDRAAVNAGLKAHEILKGDRVAVFNGNAGLSASAARTAANLNQSIRSFFVDCWFFQRDDVDGTERLVAPACALASVMANLPASTSAAWKAQAVREKLSFITRLESNRGDAAAGNTAQGICTLIKEESGGYTFEAFVNTAAPASPTKKNGTRTRMGIFVAKSIKISLREFVDAPNLDIVQQMVVGAVQVFMTGLKNNASVDPFNLEHVKEWGWGDFAAANLANDVNNGEFALPLDFQTSSQMEKILLSVQYGENVVVKFAA